MPQSVPAVPGLDRATGRTERSRRRRLRHAQTWDGISDEEILDRDGWRCQIPGCKRRPIRKDVKSPHPRSKSIDHIVPESLGGDDTAVNKRAAHLGCNMARGNRMGAEQLPLFGSVREPPLTPEIRGTPPVGSPRTRRLCECGTPTWQHKSRCRACWKRWRAEIEERRRWQAAAGKGQTCPLHYYECRYCGELKVTKKARGQQQREVCPERRCQLARLAANNLRVRKGLTAEEADAQMIAALAAGLVGRGRWQRNAA
jgi:hypothetical protein